MFIAKFKKKALRRQCEVPKHIAVIMDGNGRWAKKGCNPCIMGHPQVWMPHKKVTKTASDLGVRVLTVYAFSTENWSDQKRK